MDPDPIIEEVRLARAEFARQHDYDIDAMVRALQEESAKHGRQLVTLSPRLAQDDGVRDAS